MKSKKIWIIGAALLVAALSVFFLRKSKSGAPRYSETTVERGDLVMSVLTTGTVQPENRLEIKPPIPGRVETVLVKEGAKIRKGQVLAWMSSTERAALIDAARAKGEEEVKRWEDLYRATPVVAPINGTLISRKVESGQSFTSSDAIFVMSDRLTVKAQVDETDMAQVKLKQSAWIILDAYPSERIPAKVDQVAFEAKTTNNVTTYDVTVVPDSTPEFMRSGMTANVTFVTESKEDVLLVPNEAIVIEDGKATVKVRDESGKTASKEIKVGFSDGKQTEVVSGLQEEETVLIPEVSLKSTLNQAKNPFAPPARPKRKR